MKRSLQRINRSLFVVGVLGALTFGAAEAFGLSLPKDEADRPWCNPVKCNADCGGQGICRGYDCLCV